VEDLISEHFVVDGMNVIGSRPDGWWRDRDGAVRRLLAKLQRLAAATGDEVTLVLDGRPVPIVGEGLHGGVLVVYARRAGRDAGDDRLVEFVGDVLEPGKVRVITSDRALATRVRELGATVAGAGGFLERLDSC
jgi:predicted RNA-binding protein with PIN domain